VKYFRHILAYTVCLLGSAIVSSVGPSVPYAIADDTGTFVDVANYEPLKDVVPAAQWGQLLYPSQAGWTTERVNEIKNYANRIQTDALLVIFRGNIVIAHGSYDKIFKIHSMRKSLMSAMYGIYTDTGLLNVNSTLADYGIDDLLGLTTGEKRATVAHLLTSMSGVYHPAAYETASMAASRPPRGSHAPGTYWYYNNWDFNALVTIFNQKTGKDFFSAFEKDIAIPLQMQHFSLQNTRYYYELEKSIHPAYLFDMSAPDLARVGLLYLRKGAWNSKQIISKDWIDLSTSAIYIWEADSPSYGYGYLWYADGDRFYASGKGGNRLFVVPRHNLVVVHLVDTTNGKSISSDNVETLLQMILDAFDPSTITYPPSGGSVVITFQRLCVDSDPLKDGSQVNNVVRFNHLCKKTSTSYQQLIAVVGDEDQLFESDEVGFNLSDFADSGWVNTLLKQNKSSDPVLIRAYGRLDEFQIGDLTPQVRFNQDFGFGLRSGPNGSSAARWLDRGDAIDFRINDLNGGDAATLDAASFVVKIRDEAAPGTTVEVVVDVDGNTISDLNGPSQKGGFTTHGLTTIKNLRDGDQVLLNFAKRRMYVNGVNVSLGSSAWDAFEQAGRRNITLGALVEEEMGFAIHNLKLSISNVVNIAEALR
jgi:hypothetical protein